jgi:phosphoglycerate dehydrogenase-like enzyme
VKIVVDLVAHGPALTALQKRSDVQIEWIARPEERARELDPEVIRGADALFCMFPPTNHQVMRNLKWIQIASTGYTQLFGLDLPDRGVKATNARGCFDVPIAEWNIAMMVNLARNCPQMHRNQQSHTWDRSAIFQNEIRGRTVGFWGYGGLARETARLAKHLGMTVHVLTRQGVKPRKDTYTVAGTGDPDGILPDRQFIAGEEQAFLQTLDFLIVALPLTKSTEGLIGLRELQALRPSAFVLNPARGPIIQEPALLQVLRENTIAGAAIDTHYRYPMPAEHPLWDFPNVIFTPHIAGSSLSPRFKERVWDIFATNVDRFLCGESLLNELTREQLAGE